MWRFKAKTISAGLAYEASLAAASQPAVQPSAPSPSPAPPIVQIVTVPTPAPSVDSQAIRNSITSLQQQNSQLLANQQQAEIERKHQMEEFKETREMIENRLQQVLHGQQALRDNEAKLQHERDTLLGEVIDLRKRLLAATEDLTETETSFTSDSSMSSSSSSSAAPSSTSSTLDSLTLLFSPESATSSSSASCSTSSAMIEGGWERVGEPTPMNSPATSPRSTPTKK